MYNYDMNIHVHVAALQDLFDVKVHNFVDLVKADDVLCECEVGNILIRPQQSRNTSRSKRRNFFPTRQ